MGDPRRLKPKYESPRRIWSAERIQEESKLLEEYGLKNMRELWAMQKELKKIRREARRLLSQGEEGRIAGKQLLDKCVRLGYAKEADVTLEKLLELTIRDILERRLETRVVKRGLAKTMRQSRQLIAHGYISVKGRRMSAPSYIVPVDEEGTITYYKPINIEAPAMAQRRAAKPAPEVAAPVGGTPPEKTE